MKSLALTLAALLAVSLFAQPANAFGGLFSRQRVVVQKQVIVQRQAVVVQRQRVVVAQPFVQAVYAQPIVSAQFVQPVYSQQLVQPVVGAQSLTGGCSSFFVR